MIEDEDEEVSSVKKLEVDHFEHSKKTKKRMRMIKKQKEHIAKIQRNLENKTKESTPLFPAIMLLNNPQDLAEYLYAKLRQSGERFEVKLLIMNFVSRLIGCHKLFLLPFYSFIQKYLTSHQIEVTKILAYLIQACHDLVPPEELTPLLKTIANNFITERCTNEVITVGINTVREVITRVPALLNEPGMADFMQDLVQYGHKAHKSVMMAAHAVLNLVRELHPSLLKRKDRGKSHNIENKPSSYGALNAAEVIPGTELLEAYERGEILLEDEEDQGLESEDALEVDEDEMDEEEGDESSEDEEEAPELVEYTSDEADEPDDGTSTTILNSKYSTNHMAVDGSTGSWESVDEDEQANEESGSDSEEEEETSPTPAGRQEVTQRLEARRFLTSEDFALIERLKAAQAQRTKASKRPRKEDDEEEEVRIEGVVAPESLEPGVKMGKMSKAQRVMRILEGRKENKMELFGHGGGLTNKEKERKKNFVMVRKGKRAVAKKLQKSNSDVRWDRNRRRPQLGRERRKRRRT